MLVVASLNSQCYKNTEAVVFWMLHIKAKLSELQLNCHEFPAAAPNLSCKIMKPLLLLPRHECNTLRWVEWDIIMEDAGCNQLNIVVKISPGFGETKG